MSPMAAATLTARKISSKHTFWLVLSTTPLLASLKSSAGIHISLSTLKRRLRDCGLKRRNSVNLNEIERGEKSNQRRIGWPKLYIWVPGYLAYTSPQIWPLHSQKYSAKSTEGTGPRRHRTT